MNDEFEALPFTAGTGEYERDSEMEEERGRMPALRGGGFGRPAYRGGAGIGRGPRPIARGPRPMARPGGRPVGQAQAPAQPGRPGGFGRPGKPGPRPGRWPRGPYWGPFYGWHPYGVMVSEPVGLPLAGAEPIEPVDFPADDAAADNGAGGANGANGTNGDNGNHAGQQEIPPEVLSAVAAMTDPDKPAFTYVGSFMRSPSLLKEKVGGFYLITFPSGGKWKAYSGHTDDLKRRMQEHIREVTRLGLRAPRHKVYVSTSGLDENGRRRVEKAFHTAMLRDYLGVLTNPRTELELAAPGWQ